MSMTFILEEEGEGEGEGEGGNKSAFIDHLADAVSRWLFSIPSDVNLIKK